MSGHWPQNRAPHISSLHLNAKTATDGVTLKPGQPYPVAAIVTDPNRDPLTYQWELLPESTDLKQAATAKAARPPWPAACPRGPKAKLPSRHPRSPAPTACLCTPHDGHGNVATGNVPFLVQP